MIYVDPDQIIGIPDQPTGQVALDPDAASADKVNLSDNGYAALATAYLAPLASWRLDDGPPPTDADTGDPTTTPTAADTATPTANPLLLPPTTGQHPATLAGNLTWTTDAARGTVATFDGTTAQATTDTTVVDTAASYTITAWAKLTSAAHTAAVTAQEGTNTPAFTITYDAAANAWAFTIASADTTTPTTVTAKSSTPPTLNTWTHLAATYNATTRLATLYVNGTQTGTATTATPWAATGPFDIAHTGTTNHFPGALSTIQTWNYTLTANQITALAQQVR